MQGFADVDDRVQPGYRNVRGRIYVKAGASEPELREFLAFTTAHSPMCNSVGQPVQVTAAVVSTQAEA